MSFLFTREEKVSNDGLNIRNFINKNYGTITKAAVFDRKHDNFLVDHSWEMLNMALLVSFDSNSKSKNKIKMRKKFVNSQSDQDTNKSVKDENPDEEFLSLSSRSFAVLSHASFLVIQSLTYKKYFYKLALAILKKQIAKLNLQITNRSTSPSIESLNNDDSLSTNTSSALDASESSDDPQDDESKWLLSSNIIISRLATIFQNMIDLDSDHIRESTRLLVYFVPFADNTGVFDLLSSAIMPTNPKPIFFYQLIKAGFVEELLKSIQMLKVGNTRLNETTVITGDDKIDNLNNSKCQIYSCVDCTECVGNNLRILALLSKNKYIQKSINVNNQVFSTISQIASMNRIDAFVKNNLWKCASALCNQQTIEKHGMFMKFLFYKAMRIISEPYVNLSMSHIYSLDFLTKVMKFAPGFFLENENVMLDLMIEVIARLIGQFPDSSNLQASIARIVIDSLDYSNNSSSFFSLFSSSKNSFDEIPEKFIKNVIPLVIMTAQSRSRSAATANCVCIMHHVATLYPTSPMIAQFCNTSSLYKEFETFFMENYKIILSSNYGGQFTNQYLTMDAVNQVSNDVRMNQNPIVVA